MLKLFHTPTCSHTLYLMPITNTNSFYHYWNRMRICWRFVCASLKRTVCVGMLCSHSNKCNSSKQHPPPPTPHPLLRAGQGLARGAPAVPRDPAHTYISNQARRNPIQGRSMPPTQAAPRAEWRENHSKQWWVILQTAITDYSRQLL